MRASPVLRDETRREILGRLRLSASELASVTALVRSQLEISLAGALAAGETTHAAEALEKGKAG